MGTEEPKTEEPKSEAVAAAKSVEQQKLEEDVAKAQEEINRLKTMCFALSEFMDETQTKMGEIQNNFNQIRKNIRTILAPPSPKKD